MNKKIGMLIIGFFAAFSVGAETMTWNDCVDETLKNNYELKSAQEKVIQTKAQGWSSFASALPQLSLSTGASRSGSAFQGENYQFFSTTQNNSTSYSIGGKQLIFDGLSTLHEMLGAAENASAAEENYKTNSAAIRQELVQAFAGLLKTQELVKTSADILKLRKSQLDDITLRYQAGREHKGSYMSTEASYAQAGYNLNQAKRSLELAQAQLCNVLGRDKKDGIIVSGDFSIAESMKIEPDFEKLYKDNPTLLALTAQKNAAEYNSKAAIGSYFPSVYVNASAGRQGDAWLPQGNVGWSAGVSVSLPLFDGGSIIARTIQTQAALAQARADEITGKQKVIQTLMSSWSGLKDAYEFSSVQDKFLAAAQERAKIADAQYATGLTAFDNWTIIQDSLVSAKTSYLSAQANLLTSEAAWIQAKGGTLEDEKK
ncbi:MAG: TolC family protein [bacterium]